MDDTRSVTQSGALSRHCSVLGRDWSTAIIRSPSLQVVCQYVSYIIHDLQQRNTEVLGDLRGGSWGLDEEGVGDEVRIGVKEGEVWDRGLPGVDSRRNWLRRRKTVVHLNRVSSRLLFSSHSPEVVGTREGRSTDPRPMQESTFRVQDSPVTEGSRGTGQRSLERTKNGEVRIPTILTGREGQGCMSGKEQRKELGGM